LKLYIELHGLAGGMIIKIENEQRQVSCFMGPQGQDYGNIYYIENEWQGDSGYSLNNAFNWALYGPKWEGRGAWF
jgi:hypothetical protein